MVKYRYNGKEKRCWVGSQELPKTTEGPWKVVFNHGGAELTAEEMTSTHILSITLRKVVKRLDTIHDWDNTDYGNIVWNKELQNYQVIYGLGKVFNLYFSNYDKEQELEFWFDFNTHLVDKDKEENKPWYYYKWDWFADLNEYVYQTLSPHITKNDGEIVVIPGENGKAGQIWQDNGYLVNDKCYRWTEETDDYDFYFETQKKWESNHGRPGLIISYAPTWINASMEKKDKLTTTKWFKKLWEVWGNQGIPLVVKTYPGFVHTQLYRNYPQWYEQISAITKLPRSISNREIGSANLLVFFNCPWLNKKLDYNLAVDGQKIAETNFIKQ